METSKELVQLWLAEIDIISIIVLTFVGVDKVVSNVRPSDFIEITSLRVISMVREIMHNIIENVP